MTLSKERTIITCSGDRYYFTDNFQEVVKLPPRYYIVEESLTGFYIRVDNDITMPEKIYKNDHDFIEHVVAGFEKSSTPSTGISLIGKKGLGKSFTAKVLCYRLGLPVIRINKLFNNSIFDFLNKIDIPHVIFIDEFEKIFPEKTDGNNIASQQGFLSYLDGANFSNNKRAFIITSNNSVNEYFMNRPSRLKYVRKYYQMKLDTVKEIIVDLLEDREAFEEDLLKNINIKDLNIDILVKIIEEINMVKQPYSSFKDFFNYESSTKPYEIYIEGEDGGEIFISQSEFGENELQSRVKNQSGLYLSEVVRYDEESYFSNVRFKSIVKSEVGEFRIKCSASISYDDEVIDKLSEEEVEKLPGYKDVILVFKRKYSAF